MRRSQVADFRSSNRSTTGTSLSLFRKLLVQVLIAIGLGILLGHFYPSLGVDMKPFHGRYADLLAIL